MIRKFKKNRILIFNCPVVGVITNHLRAKTVKSG
jgi:hypothetical protein